MTEKHRSDSPATASGLDALVLCGSSALRMLRAQRRKTGFLPWEQTGLAEQRSLLAQTVPRTDSIDVPWLVRIGAFDSEHDDLLHLLVGSASNRRCGDGFAPHVCTAGLPPGSIARVEPYLYTLTPEALCAQIANELGPVVAFALAMEFCSGISLSDHSEWLPPYRCMRHTPLSKEKAESDAVGYFEVEPVMTPAGLESYLAKVRRGRGASRLRELCCYLVSDLRSPMECIMVSMFSLPTVEGGFACGPFKGDHKVMFDVRARAVSGMPYAICDAYQAEARLDFEYNGGEGHTSDSSRLHDEKRNAGLTTMGIEVLIVNKETLRDLEAMEALAWRIYKRKGKRYRNRVDGRRELQTALLNVLRTSFGLLPA